MKAIVFIAAGLAILLGMVRIGADRAPLIIEAIPASCAANPCLTVDCSRAPGPKGPRDPVDMFRDERSFA